MGPINSKPLSQRSIDFSLQSIGRSEVQVMGISGRVIILY